MHNRRDIIGTDIGTISFTNFPECFSTSMAMFRLPTLKHINVVLSFVTPIMIDRTEDRER